jgi:hypothetical protein
MNLLCPNCQKMLTVPEQYAGQLMKCPLCQGTFTVPTLPAAPPPPPPPPSAPDIYRLQDPSPAPPPSMPPSYTSPLIQPSAPAVPPPPPPPPPPPLPPGEYTRKATIGFSPKVLQFVPAVAMALIFILQLAPWVGVYFGGYAAVSQNAWGAMIGTTPTEENDLKILFRWTTEGDLKKDLANMKEGKETKLRDVAVLAYAPSFSFLALCYLLLYFPTAALTVACVVLPLLPVKLPPAVQPLLKWKWALALLLNLLLFSILLLQLALGFGIESAVKNAQSERIKTLVELKSDPLPKMLQDAMLSDAVDRVQLTRTVYVVILLHLLTIVCALLMFWLNQREAFNKPLPELTLRW